MPNWKGRLHYVREQELYMVLDYVSIPQNTRVLEIGCGDGCQSTILCNCSNHVISTDITNAREYGDLNALCDCEHLPFKDNQFDIVYSSNVLEHIQDRDKALDKMKHVLVDNGTIIIMVPTATWRIIACITYYPNIIHSLLKLMVKGKCRENKTHQSEKISMKNEKRPLCFTSYCFPPVHGAYQNIFEEIKSYSIRNWLKLFRNNGLIVEKVIKTLLYGPLEFSLPIINLSRAGICSTTAFILKVK